MNIKFCRRRAADLLLRPVTALAVLACVLAIASEALACPVCNTETGIAVQAGIFNSQFLPTVLSVLAPFPVLFAIMGTLHLCWARPTRHRERNR